MFKPSSLKILSSLLLTILFLSFSTPGYPNQSQPAGFVNISEKSISKQKRLSEENDFFMDWFTLMISQ